MKFHPGMAIAVVLVALAAWRILSTDPVTTPSALAEPATETDTYSYDDETSDDMATEWKFPGVLPAEQIENKQIRLTTNKGEIVISLYPDTAPATVSNFVYLASNGYYDGVIFHRVIEGFMIQGGDPLGQGFGGPGYKFADELKDDRQYTRGTVAMANAGANTNGSQFFIMHQDYPLPKSYSIFGQVVEGMDVVDVIATTPTDGDDRPMTEIVMEKVTVEDIK